MTPLQDPPDPASLLTDQTPEPTPTSETKTVTFSNSPSICMPAPLTTTMPTAADGKPPESPRVISKQNIYGLYLIFEIQQHLICCIKIY